MRNIILKIPGYVFLVAIFFPLFLFYIDLVDFKEQINILVFKLFASAVGAIWIISVAEYMSFESKSRKYVSLVYVFLALEFIFHLVEFFMINYLEIDIYIYNAYKVLLLSDVIIIGVLMTKIVKRVFYARTTWYAFLETTIPPIGMMTMTPDIQDWEKGDKK